MPQLFRAMKEDDQGLPQIGPSARTLGVRPGADVPAKLPREMVMPGQGGLSVSPDNPFNLPTYRRPVEFQGTGQDPVWIIADTDLGADLYYRPDPSNVGHGFIEPLRPMTLDNYERAITQTQTQWRKVSSWPSTTSLSHDN
jgi:hypothetical protein